MRIVVVIFLVVESFHNVVWATASLLECTMPMNASKPYWPNTNRPLMYVVAKMTLRLL